MGSNSKNRWFVGVARNPARECALYAFPHAGAGTTAVRDVCADLADSFDTFGVRLPGRESRLGDPVETVMATLADKLADELAQHTRGRPLVLYGHCAGTVIAYEVARRLDPAQLRGLAVSAHPAPGTVGREPTWQRPRREFFQQVVTDGFLPPEILADTEWLDIVEPAMRADYELVETYELEQFARGTVERIAAPTVAVFGRDDRTLDPAHVEAWSACTTGAFRVVSTPGSHDLPRSHPAELAAAIRGHLAAES
ncbi:medium-chain acyl-[acyl-carrier-protein] hydrolase [Catenulispora sp. GAS73]|uniref:thioesterase II family protein n=1 Tax=Catenulispora sp. GAS73 TaxID=3156269 RepID=UPI0035169F0A